MQHGSASHLMQILGGFIVGVEKKMTISFIVFKWFLTGPITALARAGIIITCFASLRFEAVWLQELEINITLPRDSVLAQDKG